MKVFNCYYLISWLAIRPDGYGTPPKLERLLKTIPRLYACNRIGKTFVSDGGQDGMLYSSLCLAHILSNRYY